MPSEYLLPSPLILSSFSLSLFSQTEETKEVIKTFAQEKAKRINKARVVREMEEQVEVAQEQVRKLRKERMRLQQKIFFSKQKIKSLEVDR